LATSSRSRLRKHYEALASRYHTTDRHADYGRLVIPNGNASEPFHRWFHLKEAYSSKLLGRIVKDDGLADRDSLRLLDPFAGGGTTLLSGVLGSPGWAGRAVGVGVERNPFLRFVASTKITAATADGRATADALRTAMGEVTQIARHVRAPVVPDQATLRNPRFYPVGTLERLLQLRTAAERLAPGIARDLILLCVATALEPSGYLRRDGRALRYDASRNPLQPDKAFTLRVADVLADLGSRCDAQGRASVLHGDARLLEGCDEARGFDLAMFSPPYPNNIDYTEVYKTEAWLLGFYEDATAFRRQRLSTLRSHPSVTFPDEFAYRATSDVDMVEALLGPLIDAVPNDRYANGRKAMIRGYIDDMLLVFRRCADLAKPDSRLVFVVGNSAHGSGDDRFEVAADLLLAGAAEIAGWRIEEIRVARNLTRRAPGSALLRESAVSLRTA